MSPETLLRLAILVEGNGGIRLGDQEVDQGGSFFTTWSSLSRVVKTTKVHFLGIVMATDRSIGTVG